MTDPIYCSAKTRSGKPCKNTVGFRTAHAGTGACYLHGGSTKNHMKHAEVEKAKLAVVAMGAPVDIHPFQAIVKSIREVAGEVEYCNSVIVQMEESDIIQRPIITHTRPLSFGKDGESTDATVTETTEQPHELNIWIKIRNDARDRLIKYSKIALDAGIDERIVKIEETQASRIAGAIFGVLSDLGIDNNRKTLTIVRQRLLTIDAESFDEP